MKVTSSEKLATAMELEPGECFLARGNWYARVDLDDCELDFVRISHPPGKSQYAVGFNLRTGKLEPFHYSSDDPVADVVHIPDVKVVVPGRAP